METTEVQWILLRHRSGQSFAGAKQFPSQTADVHHNTLQLLLVKELRARSNDFRNDVSKLPRVFRSGGVDVVDRGGERRSAPVHTHLSGKFHHGQVAEGWNLVFDGCAEDFGVQQQAVLLSG